MIVLVTILLVLGALEVSLRLFGPILPGNYTSGAYLERHPVYGFFHVRGYEGWQHSNEYFARVRFNQLGLRDPRDRYEKPPGHVPDPAPGRLVHGGASRWSSRRRPPPCWRPDCARSGPT